MALRRECSWRCMLLRGIVIFVVAVLALSAQAFAATDIKTKTLGKFTRLSFAWDSPVSMRADSRKNRLVLTFSKPINENISVIKTQLSPHVKAVSRSKNRKTLTIVFSKAYRVRQFLSKNTNGVDIFTQEVVAQNIETTPKKQPPKTKISKPAPPPLVKPKPILTTKPVTKDKKGPEKSSQNKSATSVVKKAAPSEKLPNAKQPKQAKLEAETQASKEGKKTKTKPVEKPATSKKVAGAEPKPKQALKLDNQAKLPAPVAANTEKQSVKTAAKQAASAASKDKKLSKPVVAPVAKTTIKSSDKELLVGLVKDSAAPTLEFAWSERTALATFVRDNDLWVIFSRTKPVNVAALISILPENILGHVEEFALPGHTVLRFLINKPVYPQASHVTGSYHWRIALHPAPRDNKQAVKYMVEDQKGQRVIRFKNTDAASTISFYDPVYEDRFLIAPLYDDNHAISNKKYLSGSDILKTGQGIAVRSDDDTLRMIKERSDILLTGSKSLPALKNLPFLPGQRNIGQVPSEADKIVIAYHKFFEDAKNFATSRARIARELAAASKAARPQKLHELAGVYIVYGFGPETAKILTDIKKEYPQYYQKNKLAIMHTAALFLSERLGDSATILKSAKIDQSLLEAQLWNDVLGLYGKSPLLPSEQVAITAPKEAGANQSIKEKNEAEALEGIRVQQAQDDAVPTFDLLRYHDKILRYYPPRIRQKISVIAADNYIQRKQYKNAVKVFDLLSNDGILKPVQPFAEYLFGRIAAEKGEVDRALKVWEKLIERDEDPFITARSEFAVTNLLYDHERISIQQAIERLEKLRIDWRYDSLEQELLQRLGQLYKQNKQYDLTLRTWKEYLNYYPAAPDVLDITIAMNKLYEDLYIHNLADDLEPLQSLALFYEFRHLIPVDDRGDKIVRKLADRLIEVDLTDRAIALLAYQIKFRSEGEDRSILGARLALLYLQSDAPRKALEALEATNYGDLPAELAQIRTQLMAEALAKVGSHNRAFAMLRNDHSKNGKQLKLNIVWEVEDWPNVVDLIEDQLAQREDFTAPLNNKEQDLLMRLALAYSFKGDVDQLKYLRDYYFNLIPEDSSNKGTFDYLTDHNQPLDPKNLGAIASQITGTKEFLGDLKTSLKAIANESSQPQQSQAPLGNQPENEPAN